MAKSKCCVVSKDMKKSERIALISEPHESLACQFTDEPSNYEFKNEHFCLLHLPYEAKKQQNLFHKAEKVLEEYINLGFCNFSYIHIKNISISELEAKDIILLGAYFNLLNIYDSSITKLDVLNAEIYGQIYIRNSNIQKLSIKNCNSNSDISIVNSHVTSFKIINTKFQTNIQKLLQKKDSQYFNLNESTVENLSIEHSAYDGVLSFENATILSLLISDTTFLQCPSFYHADFKSVNTKLSLPSKQSFKLVLLKEQFPLLRGTYTTFIHNLKRYHSLKKAIHHAKRSYKDRKKNRRLIFRRQYNRFREIYNLTKDRGMLLEQGDYFFLMQRSLEFSAEENLVKVFISSLYRWLSDYGQSIKKPIMWILFSWLFAYFNFIKLLPKELNHPFRISIQQLIKPFQILFVDNLPNLIYIIGFMESACFIICLPLLLIALRWHFRKV